MAQTEEFMFQNVAYRTTVYRIGAISFGLPIKLTNCHENRARGKLW